METAAIEKIYTGPPDGHENDANDRGNHGWQGKLPEKMHDHAYAYQQQKA